MDVSYARTACLTVTATNGDKELYFVKGTQNDFLRKRSNHESIKVCGHVKVGRTTQAEI